MLLHTQFCLLYLGLSAAAAAACTKQRAEFHKITGADCVRSDFTNVVWGSCDKQSCSLLCAKKPKCRAFTLPDGACLCKMFLFDECSHRVQSEANCTHQVTVYVRSVAGVEADHLCPQGYEFARFGTAYKVSASPAATWADAKEKCGQEAGLSKFADALDVDESRHLMWIKKVSNIPVESFYLGGHQMLDSASRTEGWIWDACNESIRNDVWEPGRPNNGLPNEGCANVFESHETGINDAPCNSQLKFICECQVVF